MLCAVWFACAGMGLAQAAAPAAPQPGTPPTRSQFHEPAALDFSDHTGFTQIFDLSLIHIYVDGAIVTTCTCDIWSCGMVKSSGVADLVAFVEKDVIWLA